jgi:hypothetical protein
MPRNDPIEDLHRTERKANHTARIVGGAVVALLLLAILLLATGVVDMTPIGGP